MGQIVLGRGTRYLLNNRSYEIAAEIARDTYTVFDIEYPIVTNTINREELAELLQEGQLQFSEKGKNTEGDFIKKYDFDDLSMLPEEMQEKAMYRFNVIKPFIKLEVDSLSPYVQARIDQLKEQGKIVSRASLYRWLKDYKDSNNDIRSLIPSAHRSGNFGKRLYEEVEVIIERTIDKYYLSKEKKTVKTIFELVSHQINVENKTRSKTDQLPLPSESTVLRRINDRDEYKVTKARKGEKTAWEKHGQINPFEKPTYPLQRVEADHTRLDLFVVDDETRLPIGRPWVTSILDVYTGYPLGFYIGFEPPSYTSVMHALNHAIFTKGYMKKTYPKMVNNWVAHGLPEVLVVDNGKEFHSKHLRNACDQLQIELVHCPPGKPWYKGAVERYFGTINRNLIHQTKGTSFSNVMDKGEYNPEKNAVISFNKLLEYFHKWVVDLYAIDFNKGVKGVPIKLWEKSFEFLPSPALPSTSIDWKIILMKIEKGSIQRSGIRYKHLFYQSDKFVKLLHEINVKGMKNSVDFKYDPTDISKVFVYNPFDYSYFEVLCSDQDYSQGLNEYTHRVILKKLNEEKKNVDKEALAAARFELEEMMASEHKLTLTERQKVKRVKGKGSNQIWTEEEKEKKTVLEKKSKPELKTEPIEMNLPKSKKEQKVVNLFADDINGEWGILNAE